MVNRDSMGKFSVSNNNIYQELAGALPGGVFAMPAYFNNTIYYGSVGSPIQAFTITNAKLSTFRYRANREQFQISRRDPQRLGQRHEQRNRVGCREH